MQQNLLYHPILPVILGLYIALSYQTLALGGKVNYFFKEDSVFEDIGAISLFAASGLFFYGFLQARSRLLKDKTHWIKQLVFLLFALITFFGAGEEISWGQRIFHIQTPAVLENINAQDELNIHNIEFNGAQLNFEMAFDVLWLIVMVVLPIAFLVFRPLRDLASLYLPFVYLPVGGLFMFNYLWAKLAKLVYSNVYNFSETIPFVQAVQEIKESHYELLFAVAALFATLNLVTEKSRSREFINVENREQHAHL